MSSNYLALTRRRPERPSGPGTGRLLRHDQQGKVHRHRAGRARVQVIDGPLLDVRSEQGLDARDQRGKLLFGQVDGAAPQPGVLAPARSPARPALVPVTEV